ncbi:MAG: tannase/feruloyl esterase family alpha/beta hydrolase [Thainema sp.]
MKKLVLATLLGALTFIGFSLFRSPANAQSPVCQMDSLRALPDVTITSVTPADEFAPHCKVAGVIGPEIHFELLLPEQWNGKFVMGGGSGFVGSVMNAALSYGALQSGYATVGTDTGHQGHPLDASWALNNMERVVNFGHQAVHRTAVTAKALVQAYYGQAIAKSYFIGCSRGGGQALMEAQRYPDDFDGIVAGAPAQHWTDGAAGLSIINRAMYPDPNRLQQAIIGPEQQDLIATGYLAQCDALDGIEDGILNDPRDCHFDVTTLLCPDGETDGCLTATQLDAVQVIYDGPKDAHGNRVFYGFPFGGETDPDGWTKWLTGGLIYTQDEQSPESAENSGAPSTPVVPSLHYGFGQGLMKYLIYHDPDWSYPDGFDIHTFRDEAQLVAATLDATQPDLSAFRQHGGKLLMYIGWSDAAITPLGTIAYYEDVLANDVTAREDVRFFLMPGVSHCAEGKGPDWVNFLDELDQWVTTHTAPDEITAYWLDEESEPTGSRRLCAYPQIAQYDGQGNPQDVKSFRCVQKN